MGNKYFVTKFEHQRSLQGHLCQLMTQLTTKYLADTSGKIILYLQILLVDVLL